MQHATFRLRMILVFGFLGLAVCSVLPMRAASTRVDAAFGQQWYAGDTVPRAAPQITTGAVAPFVREQSLNDPAAMKGDRFGAHVALSGDSDTLAVARYGGTSDGHNAVYVYRRNGGSYGTPQILTDPAGTDSRAFGSFGFKMMLSAHGDTLAVVRYRTSDGHNAVSVYRRNGGSYDTPQVLTDPAPVEGDSFGYALALSADGNTLVIGEPGAATAYVYRRNGGSFGAFQTLTDPAPRRASFGFAVALSADGDTLVVGRRVFSFPTTDPDSTYVYRSSSDGYTIVQTLTDPAPTKDDQFGYVLALSADGNTLAVCASDTRNTGNVYVYRRSGGSFDTPQNLADPGGMKADNFGSAVTLSADGNTIAAGTYGGGSHLAKLYIYQRSGGSYTMAQTLPDPAAMENGYFSDTAALSADGTILAVGAPGSSDIEGKAYIFAAAPTVSANSTASPALPIAPSVTPTPSGLYPRRLGDG